jgi:hypothetical protein
MRKEQNEMTQRMAPGKMAPGKMAPGKMRSPGIEPGSITWQATIITTRPRTLSTQLRMFLGLESTDVWPQIF